MTFTDRCQKCGNEYDFKKVGNILTDATKELAEMGKLNEDACIKYIDKYSKWLAKDHYLLTEVRISLGQLIGQLGAIQKVSEERLNLKMNINKHLIQLVEKLAPGNKFFFRLYASLEKLLDFFMVINHVHKTFIIS